jgi:hypothetical protein
VSKPPKPQAGIWANGCVGDINQTGETYIFEESLFSQIFSTFIFPYLLFPKNIQTRDNYQKRKIKILKIESQYLKY